MKLKPETGTQIKHFLAREERRQAFDAEANTAFSAYEATGEHMTGEEVDIWFKKLEARTSLRG